MLHPASFWKRFGAAVIDTILFAPISFVIDRWALQSQSRALALVFPQALLISLLVIFFHGRFGATPGKILLRIKVVDVLGHPITYSRALRRQSVELLLGMLSAGFLWAAYAKIEPEFFTSAAGKGYFSPESLALYAQLDQSGLRVVSWITNIWFVLEFATMLLNKEKRAIHDFIGGTRVVDRSDR